MHQPATGNLPFGALAKDALQIGNWIGRMGERIGPLLVETRMNDLPHNRVSQIVFALEVMKERAFRRTGSVHDPVEATALESVFVKFVKRSLEYFSSRVFWRSGHGRFHSMVLRYRPVGMSSSSILLFSILEFGLCVLRHLTIGEGLAFKGQHQKKAMDQAFREAVRQEKYFMQRYPFATADKGGLAPGFL